MTKRLTSILARTACLGPVGASADTILELDIAPAILPWLPHRRHASVPFHRHGAVSPGSVS
jgi:hypothetical protein